MPKMVATHPVRDVDRWLQGKDERGAVIGRYTTNVTDRVAADGSNNVAVIADIHDMAGLQAPPQRRDKATEEGHGVMEPMTVKPRSSPSGVSRPTRTP